MLGTSTIYLIQYSTRAALGTGCLADVVETLKKKETLKLGLLKKPQKAGALLSQPKHPDRDTCKEGALMKPFLLPTRSSG